MGPASGRGGGPTAQYGRGRRRGWRRGSNRLAHLAPDLRVDVVGGLLDVGRQSRDVAHRVALVENAANFRF